MSTSLANLYHRIDNLPLYLHAYSFHLNMRYEKILPTDLLNIAKEQNLSGVKIHVLDGESRSLINDEQMKKIFAHQAKKYNLDIHIETSQSDPKSLDEAANLALDVGATSVRFYPRYEGYLDDVLKKAAQDIAYLNKCWGRSGLTFVIEQHEDLKSDELVELVKSSGMSNLALLFDFGNMINAGEDPMEALKTMSKYVTQVHIKDAMMKKEIQGYGHIACKSGQGQLPMKDMLKYLLQLNIGNSDQPQVIAYGLEEEVDYYAPPFRWKGQENNPFIPFRTVSETPLPTHDIESRLQQEYDDALRQIRYVRLLLATIKEEL